jgi:hypothetical protein
VNHTHRGFFSCALWGRLSWRPYPCQPCGDRGHSHPLIVTERTGGPGLRMVLMLEGVECRPQ